MVRYPFDGLRALSKVEPLIMIGKTINRASRRPFALRYRMVNGTFCRSIEERRLL
jgi:hypothetical protein